MKRLFYFIDMIKEMKGIADCDNNGYELSEILKNNENILKHLCDLIFEAKSNYEHIKEIL